MLCANVKIITLEESTWNHEQGDPINPIEWGWASAADRPLTGVVWNRKEFRQWQSTFPSAGMGIPWNTPGWFGRGGFGRKWLGHHSQDAAPITRLKNIWQIMDGRMAWCKFYMADYFICLFIYFYTEYNTLSKCVIFLITLIWQFYHLLQIYMIYHWYSLMWRLLNNLLK